MRLRHPLWIALVLVVYGNVGDVWAYGDSGGNSGSADACAKVKFSVFTPGNNTEVAAKSAFSFFASEGTAPKSIAVTVKGQSVPVTVTPKHQGFQVTGVLPDTLKGTFARINITGKGPNQCEASDGWLLKVAN